MGPRKVVRSTRRYDAARVTTSAVLNGLRSRLPLRARADAAELLDGGTLSADEVAVNLADLARLNRLPGGTRASVRAVASLLDGRGEARVLDVGTGRADMPIAFARAGWTTTALDSNDAVVRVARAATAGFNAIDVANGDARALPFDNGTFDVVHSSLLVHHLDPDDAVTALREMARVSRIGVVVNDLRRGTLPLLATWATTGAFGRSRVTRVDGLASARRAYTLRELDVLLEAADLVVHRRSASWMPRVVTSAVRA